MHSCLFASEVSQYVGSYLAYAACLYRSANLHSVQWAGNAPALGVIQPQQMMRNEDSVLILIDFYAVVVPAVVDGGEIGAALAAVETVPLLSDGLVVMDALAGGEMIVGGEMSVDVALGEVGGGVGPGAVAAQVSVEDDGTVRQSFGDFGLVACHQAHLLGLGIEAPQDTLSLQDPVLSLVVEICVAVEETERSLLVVDGAAAETMKGQTH